MPALERPRARAAWAGEVLLCLGAFAWDAALRLRAQLDVPTDGPGGGGPARGIARGRPKFAHGAVAEGARLSLLGCYHPSQQNTFTGRLTEAMLDQVLLVARELAGLAPPAPTDA